MSAALPLIIMFILVSKKNPEIKQSAE